MKCQLDDNFHTNEIFLRADVDVKVQKASMIACGLAVTAARNYYWTYRGPPIWRFSVEIRK